eukprot:SAG31_NODE_48525_length_183_cov_19.321429_1_plen_53_part_01
MYPTCRKYRTKFRVLPYLVRGTSTFPHSCPPVETLIDNKKPRRTVLNLPNNRC